LSAGSTGVREPQTGLAPIRRYDMYGFKRILVPSDFSECSSKALGTAITLAVGLEADLFLIYVEAGAAGSKVWMSNEATRAELDSLEGNEKQLFDEYMRVSREIEAETGRSPIPRDNLHLRVAGGETATEILKASADAQIDLIVMGTHGRTSIKDYFVGSTTERVVERATCSVLSVKPDGYPYLRD
jgi:nucleotide-binding universal stress UspA family protein